MTDAGDPASGEAPPAEAVHVPPRRPTPLYAWLSTTLLRIEARARARGSRRTRLTARLAWTLVAALGGLLLAGPVINEPMGFEDYLDAARSGTDTWIARSFEADYVFARDDDGRLRAEVEERITALFPEDVDESAVERVVASQYEGHDVRPSLVSAELDGEPVEARTTQRATRTEFAIDAGERLSGTHEVVLRYTLADVAFDSFDESTRAWTQQLEWDAFGPEWAHGTADTAVTVTLPRELADAQARTPRAGLEWLLVSDSTSLTPDRQSADAVTYEVTNDQTLPPHSAFWFRFHFAPGTLVMPSPPPLYWVMVVGPFVPLLLAAIALLCALAARAVAWGDARGRAWYVVQSDPPDGIDPTLAARLWRAVGAAPLVRALADYQASTPRSAGRGEVPARGWRRRRRPRAEAEPRVATPAREEARRRLAREVHRAGRLGNWPHAWREYLGAAAWREAFARRLRRVPAGFVRDNFIGAALALPLVQLGLARQLSHQFPLSVFWWPVAVVAVAILLGAAVLTIALSARPLTRQGAFAREHLLGIRLFADRTSLADRGTLGDPLLPYAVMFARPRRAAGIVRRAMDDAGVARDVAADPTFLGAGRLLIRGAAVIAVAGALMIANLVPSPTVRPEYDAVFEGDVPGSYGMFVREFAADARLGVGAGGTPVLEVDERLQVTVADGGRDVRQVTRQWTDRPEGQDTALTVTGVTIDGEPAPYETGRLQGKALLRTTLADDWPGEHEVVVSYRLDRPVGTTSSGAGWHDELRWTAIDPHWTFGWEGLGDDDETIEVERVDVSLTVPEDIAERAASAGALDQSGRDPVAVRAPDAIERRDGQVTYRLSPEPQDDAGPLGMRLLFDEGALADGGRTAWLAWAAWQAAPIALNLVLGALGLVLGVIGILRGRRLGRGALRDAVLWAGPATAAAQLPLFVWATADWSGEEPWFAVMGLLLLAALAASVWSVIVTRRPDSRAPGGRGSRARRAP